MSKLSVNELTDETGSGAPSFPNGVSVTGAALTDPEITGGIFLGGTGSANKLDDYETGTWTTTFGSTKNLTGAPSLTEAIFHKVGNLVFLEGEVQGYSISSTDVETLFVFTTPFLNVSNTSASVGMCYMPSDRTVGAIQTNTSGNSTEIAAIFKSSSITLTGGVPFRISITYQST